MFSGKLLEMRLCVFISQFLFDYKMAHRISCPLCILIFFVASVFRAWRNAGTGEGSHFFGLTFAFGEVWGRLAISEPMFSLACFLSCLLFQWMFCLWTSVFFGVGFRWPWRLVAWNFSVHTTGLFSSRDWVGHIVDSGGLPRAMVTLFGLGRPPVFALPLNLSQMPACGGV